jgi:hypothetical protein
LRTLAEKSCLKATKSSRPATGRILSTIPSSSSNASHLSHRNMYLQRIQIKGSGISEPL